MSTLRQALTDRLGRRVSLEEIAVVLDISLSTAKRRAGEGFSADDTIRAARALGAPVIELLIDLGHLSRDDVASAIDTVRVTSLDRFTDVELAEEILRRVTAGTATQALTAPVGRHTDDADDYMLAASEADYDEEAEAQQYEP